MKRSILYFSLFMLLGISVFAQNLVIRDTTGTVINNGDTVSVSCQPSILNYIYLDIENTGTDSLAVKAKKAHISLVSGGTVSICWGSCWPPSYFVAPDSIWIAPDSIVSEFSAEFNAHGNFGTSIVRFTFWDVANPADSAHVFVKFEVSHNNGVAESAPEKIQFSNAFPNPANTYSVLSYNLPANSFENRIVVRDMLGNEVVNEVLFESSGTIRIDTNPLGNGVYFYSLILNGKPYATRKLIVKH